MSSSVRQADALGQIVSVIDDDPHTREEAVFWLQRSGYSTKCITGRYGMDIERLVLDAACNASYVFTDQRLSTHGLTQFQGVELAARLNDIGKPTIVVTQFTETDEARFKPYRPKVPIILPRSRIDKVDFKQLFSEVERELVGVISVERLLYRTAIMIESVEGTPPSVVVAFIPAWKIDSAITFPLDIVPVDIRDEVRAGRFLFARVNINAPTASSLYFKDFELAPEIRQRGF